MNGLYKYLQALVVLVLVTTLLGLSSCDKNSVETNTTDTQAAIGFSNITTKATITDLQAKGFGVWAFVNTMPDDDPFMDNIQVTYDGNLDNWGYEPVKYWIDESVFTFVATYPYDEDGDIYTSSTGAVQLTLSETPSDIDYLVARNTIDTSDPNFDPSASVDLQFKHLLSNVSLNVWRDHGKHQNDKMRVRKVTLSNIRKAGTYSSVADAWAPTNDKLAMEYTNDNVTDDDDIGAATKTDGSYDFSGTPSAPFSGLMLLPQTIDASSNSVSLKIQYELKRNNAADWESAELETILPAISWEQGKQYVYNVVLSSVTDITVYYIQTKVDPWGTPQVGGTVIIK